MDPTMNQIGLVLFLLANLVIGLYAGRKTRTFKEYALANRSLGLGILSMTLIATFVGGAYLQRIENTGNWGLTSFVPQLSIAVMNILFMGWFVFPKLGHFKECYTLGDIMERLFGRFAALFVVAVSAVVAITAIATQLIAMGQFSQLLGMDSRVMIGIIGLTLVAYTFFGGVRSVAATDVLQFLFCVVGFVFLAHLVLSKSGLTPFTLFERVRENTPEKLTLFASPSLKTRFLAGLFWFGYPSVVLLPPIVQRALMTRNKKELKSMFNYSALFVSLLMFLVLLIGLGASSIPGFDLSTKGKLPSLLLEQVLNDSFAQTLLLFAFISIMMSTADSHLNAVTALLAHNFVSPWLERKGKKHNEVTLAKGLSLVLGLFSVLLAVSFDDTHPTTVLAFGLVLFSSISVPFVAGVMGLKTSPRMFKVALGAFFGSALLVVLFRWNDFRSVSDARTLRRMLYPICPWLILPSGVAFFLAHCFEFGGFKVVSRKKSLETRVEKYASTRGRGSFAWYGWLTSWKGWSQERIKIYGKPPYAFFGLFMAILYMIPSFTTTQQADDTFHFMVLVYLVGITLCSGLLLERKWGRGLRGYLPAYWYVTLLYCLPCARTALFLKDPADPISLISFVLSMLLLIVLVDWQSFFVLQLLGSALGLVLHRLYTGCFFPEMAFETKWSLGFGTLFTLVIGLAFARKKEARVQRERSAYRINEEAYRSSLDNYINIHHQLANTYHPESSMMQELRGVLTRVKEEDAVLAARGESALVHFQQMANKSREFIPLNFGKHSFDDLVLGAFYRLKREEVDLSRTAWVNESVSRAVLECDRLAVEELIANGLRYVYEACPVSDILFKVEETLLSYPSSDKGLSEEPALRVVFTSLGEVPKGEASYFFQPEGTFYERDRSFVLEKNKQIVQGHYGAVLEKEDAEGVTLAYIFPKNAGRIVPKIGLFSDEDFLDGVRLDAPADRAFLARVKKEKKGWDVSLIERALSICKHYHRHQVRKSGEPFYLHPLAVADILMDCGGKEEEVIAALLHDVVEDTPFTIHQVVAIFGERVKKIVDDVTHLYSYEMRKVRLDKASHLEDLLGGEAMDAGATLVKLADRLHNMETIKGHPSVDKRRAIAEETRKFFIPLANLLKQDKIEARLRELVDGVLRG